jgi:hypothetical protein
MQNMMNRMGKIGLLTILFTIPVISFAVIERQDSFSPYVDEKGTITLPSGFESSWVHLGTWIVTSQAAAGPSAGGITHANGLHEVYTQPDSLKAFKATGSWPDGTVLVLDVRPVLWDDMPTGHVMYAGDEAEAAVMIKDSQGRFKDHPNWGKGWGWALFKSGEPQKVISKDHQIDCLGCHEVAGDSDFVFVQGYPVLR